jgi:hypothetical protein
MLPKFSDVNEKWRMLDQHLREVSTNNKGG